MTPIGYRGDIDGLRAVAVLSVLFFHAGIWPFSGGFVGVDVFFVISGYLITTIILNDLNAGRFSIAQFYERRIRRIFPALLLTVAITVAGALALFSATELESLFASLVWLSFFASNFYFAQNSGYFDGAAEQNATLHTWSLAIEEQFYVVFPALLAFVLRRRLDARWVFLSLAIASFAFSIYIVDRDARPAFFSTPGRIWELLLGVLAAVGLFPRLTNPKVRTAISVAGLAAIAASVFLLDGDTPFPGAYALPACAGTAAIIWAGACGETPVTRWLGWRPLVFVGLISYSLYLLHWPLIVFARHWAGRELSAVETAAVLAASFAGAWASWRFVETPMRDRRKTPIARPALIAVAALLMLVLGLGSDVGARRQQDRYSVAERVIEVERQRALAEPCLMRDKQTFADWPAEACAKGDAIAVWGDSFAAHYFGHLRTLAPDVTMLGAASCPPIAGLDVPNRPGCGPFNRGALELIEARKPKVVILSADWMIYEKKKTVAEVFDDKYALLAATVDRLRNAGARVVVIGPSPMFPAPAARMAASDPDLAGPGTAKANYSRRFDRFFRDLAGQGKIAYFPAYRAFCSETLECRYREGAELLFWDTGHLTARGSERALAALAKAFPDLGLAAKASDAVPR